MPLDSPAPLNEKFKPDDKAAVTSSIWRLWFQKLFDLLGPGSTLGKVGESGGAPTWDGGPWPAGANASPASSVQGLDGTSVVGTSLNYARQDHKHGGTFPATQISYSNPTYTTVDSALNALLYVAPNVTLSGGSTNEVGTTVTSVSLSWTINKTGCTFSIDNGIGAVTTSPYVHSGQTITNNRTYVITANDGSTNDTASTTVAFVHRRWYGSADQTLFDALTAYTSGDFSATNLAALTSALSESHTLSANSHPANGYPIFAVVGTTPLSCSWAGTPVDIVQKTVTVVNQYNESSSYRIGWIADYQSAAITLSWS